MPRILEMINVLGYQFWLTGFLRTFPSFLLTCTTTILILISILVFFCFMFMFPLLGDKLRFKFGGVISILYTHFINNAYIFSSFII